MASSSSPTEDPVITVKQEHENGDSFITLKQHDQTTITVKKEHETGDSIITVKHEHQTGDSIITVKHEHETGDSIITVKQQQHPTREEDSFINVKIREMTGRVMGFRVKRDEPLQRLMMRWSDQDGTADYDIVRFVYNARIINGDQNKTTNDIGLKDGDCITALRSLMGD
ncbi:hypothetical protein OSB04_017359 [Centaurea solstitialis]|uniref:Ubiquitin-like domain-containing protein n=1 Tax=Centaurea solstitialis TaxID=347529 RepID=A0AA38T4D4_9ASTR|nr:hypothetical protein OSB04_017359 [Centaurea solstitialis]